MDGIHDLGGREGFGPIPDKEDGRPFRAEWETRAFGIAQSSGGGSDWTIDWFRHCRELIPPTDYLSRQYFDQWMLTVAAQMIDEGYLTLDEVKAGVSSFTPQPGYPPASAAEARAYVRAPRSYAMPVPQSAAFAVGSPVRARLMGPPGHTRLPGYVRGRQGLVVAHHGAHVVPDASARGEHRAGHLYTVSFAASDLWSEARESQDRILVDLWEEYLEPV
jgi:nitrile hydratase beta subunit